MGSECCVVLEGLSTFLLHMAVEKESTDPNASMWERHFNSTPPINTPSTSLSAHLQLHEPDTLPGRANATPNWSLWTPPGRDSPCGSWRIAFYGGGIIEDWGIQGRGLLVGIFRSWCFRWWLGLGGVHCCFLGFPKYGGFCHG